MSILHGETTFQEAARKHGLTVAELEEWQERFLSEAENSLRTKPRDDEAQEEKEWRRHCNNGRAHSRPGNLTPREFINHSTRELERAVF